MASINPYESPQSQNTNRTRRSGIPKLLFATLVAFGTSFAATELGFVAAASLALSAPLFVLSATNLRDTLWCGLYGFVPSVVIVLVLTWSTPARYRTVMAIAGPLLMAFIASLVFFVLVSLMLG